MNYDAHRFCWSVLAKLSHANSVSCAQSVKATRERFWQRSEHTYPLRPGYGALHWSPTLEGALLRSRSSVHEGVLRANVFTGTCLPAVGLSLGLSVLWSGALSGGLLRSWRDGRMDGWMLLDRLCVTGVTTETPLRTSELPRPSGSLLSYSPTLGWCVAALCQTDRIETCRRGIKSQLTARAWHIDPPSPSPPAASVIRLNARRAHGRTDTLMERDLINGYWR